MNALRVACRVIYTNSILFRLTGQLEHSASDTISFLTSKLFTGLLRYDNENKRLHEFYNAPSIT